MPKKTNLVAAAMQLKRLSPPFMKRLSARAQACGDQCQLVDLCKTI
jgi:hypothetical protein